jgi:hypothetical protein
VTDIGIARLHAGDEARAEGGAMLGCMAKIMAWRQYLKIHEPERKNILEYDALFKDRMIPTQ